MKQAKVPVDGDETEPQVCVIEVHSATLIAEGLKGFSVSKVKEPVGALLHSRRLSLQLGGTVGDIESMPFVEAFRQFQFKVKRENFCNIHVSLIPQVGPLHASPITLFYQEPLLT